MTTSETKPSNILIAVISIIVVIATAAIIYLTLSSQEQAEPQTTEEPTIQILPAEDVTPLEATSGLAPDQQEEGSNITTDQAGNYDTYSQAKVTNATQEKIVLFFHAGWCPTCRVLDENLEDNRGEIPSDLLILKVNYDEETDLAKKYGVTYQHTLVQVDRDGNEINKWSGSYSLDEIVSNIK